MREIVVVSGKGGTGKTSLAASLALTADKRVVTADCDVDAADLHLILKPHIINVEVFYSGAKATINPVLCNGCALCQQVCRFAAVNIDEKIYRIDSLRCEGCVYCSNICPQEAIIMKEQRTGRCYLSSTKTGGTMVHAKLGIGADNSGKLVTRVKEKARGIAEQHGYEFIIVDGSPGIGCPVIASIAGANITLIVTEPTRSGLYDMQRLWMLIKKFKIPAACVINKSDLNLEITREIENYLVKENIQYVYSIPYDGDFQHAIAKGQSLVEHDPAKWQPVFEVIWEKLSQSEVKK